jgi:alkanesulfonate monooxygenase SsuD/methylene tetrahydromethanopterin reductase-like flavin-dependent oxidoreductase (luciferase family)
MGSGFGWNGNHGVWCRAVGSFASEIVLELAGAFDLNRHQEAFMDFGLFYYCQGRGAPHDQAYHEMLDQIVLAETLGFGECWFAEHHFTDYSLLPSPNLMIASAVQRTSHMRFGNYVNAMSFHHPLRLAAEAAMLDNLARGRFDFGVGKGVRQGEFAKLGLNFDDGVAMTEEAVEIVLKVWTQETCSHTGRFWSFPELSLRPRVYQQPYPPLHEVASRPASVARVGAKGWPVAMHFTPTEVVAQAVQDYHAALAKRDQPLGEGPYRPRLLLCRETYVAETEEQARAEGALGLQGFYHLSSLAAPPPPAEFSDERLKSLTRSWGGRSFDEMEALGAMLIGSPERIAAKVEHLESIGIDTLLLVCSFGSLSHEQVCRSLELFASAAIRPRQPVATSALG